MSLVDVDYGKNRCCKYEILPFYQTLFCDNFMYTFIHFNFIFTSSCSGCLVEDISFSSFRWRGKNTMEYFARFAKIFQSYKARV